MNFCYQTLLSRHFDMLLVAERYPAWARLLIGVGLAILATGFQLLLSLVIGDRLPFLIFIPTLALVAAIIGHGAGLVVLAAGAMYGIVIFEPIYRFRIANTPDRIAWIAFVATGLLFIYVGSRVRLIARWANDAEQLLARQQLQHELDAAVRLGELFSQAPGFITVLQGPDHVYVFENEAHASLIGYRKVIGKPVREALPDLQGQGLYETLDQVFQTGTIFKGTEQQVMLARGPDGRIEQRFVDFIYQPIRNAHGAVTGVFVEGFDVTEQKRSRDALRESQQRLREGLSAARMTVWKWDVDTDHVTLFENGDELFGLTGETCQDPWSLVHADDREKLTYLKKMALATQERSVVVRVLRPVDHTYVWLQLRATLEVGEEGTLSTLRGIALDVTTEIQAEALAAEQERKRAAADANTLEISARLTLAVDAAGLGIFHCPAPLKKIYWNDTCKRHFFLPEDADVDFDLFYSLLHPEDRERTRQAIETAVFQKESYDIEYRTVAPDGRTRWIRAKGLAYYDDNGQPVRFDGITIDIQQQKEAEAALTLANRQKDEFLAMLAHELRNPLAPISAASSVLALPELDRDRIIRTSAIISRQVKHMSELLDDLLDVSRVTRGTVDLDKKIVDLKAVLSAAAEQVLPLIKQKGHRLTTHVPPERIYVSGDEKRLVQVFANLLANAARYTPNGGIVDVLLSSFDQQVQVEIRDNGIGMPAELLVRAFDLFVQGERTLDRRQGGLGIGLSLVKSLVELHGGTVAASSDGPGQGSAFTIRLALLTEITDPMANATAAPAASGSRLKLMVVDDNEDGAKSLTMYLEAQGHTVIAETDPLKALRTSVDFRPEVFILDIGMPGMDGYELVRQLRARPHAKTSRMVAISGYGQEQDVVAAKQAGFDQHFVKPIDIGALASWLASSIHPS
jgi:PAS domain S-box-containing protein